MALLDLKSAQAIGDAIGFGMAVAGGAIGDGLLFSRVVEGTARQPEMRGQLMSLAFIGVAVVEALPIISLVLFIIHLIG
jgi:F-type H+-transporting ATPase subunit c